MTIVLASAAALALSAAPPCGLPPLRAGGLPWTPGESLTFDLAVAGVVKGGTLSIAVERPMFRGTLVPLRARVRNTSVFAKIRKVTAVALSWVDPTTLRPERYRDESTEDGVHKTSDARLAPPGAEVVIQYQFGEKKGSLAYPRQHDVLDIVSAIYYLRASDLRPGGEFCFDLVANRRLWRFSGIVVRGTERVETPAGTFDTIRIDATALRADRPETRRPLHLWIGTDPRRLLVAAVSEVDLGPVSAMLTRVSGSIPVPGD